jgi:hypothetical protein
LKTVYIFYLCDTEDKLNENEYPGIQSLEVLKRNNLYHVLYAWTINKSIRKKFKKQRDMNLFKEVVCDIDDENLDKFSDKYSNTFLEERPITTKTIENHIICKTTTYVLATKNELDYIVENNFYILQKQLEGMLSSDIYIREAYFKDVYRKALHFFKLDEILAYTYPLDDGDIPFLVIAEDTLAIYTHLYYNTYRKEIDNL